MSEIVNNFAKLGHDVHLIALKKGNLKLHSNVKFYGMFPFINKRFLSLATLYVQKIHVKSLIKKIIKKENIDIVYERHGTDHATKIAFCINIPVVLEVNGNPSDEAESQGADKKTIEEIDELEKEKLRMPNKIIAVTEGTKDYCISLGIDKKKIVVIPNGANINIFKPMDQKECRNHLGLGDYPIITFVGAFRQYQGLEHAIESMHYILQEIPNAKLMLVGDSGEYRGYTFRPTIQDLRSLAEKTGVGKNIIFTGRVPYEMVPYYINASDVCIALVMEQKSGQSSLKIYEYMACGKPVIARNTSGYEIINEYKTGILVNPEDKKEISNAIINLLRDDKLRAEIGCNSRKLIIENYSWENITKKIVMVCEDVVNTI